MFQHEKIWLTDVVVLIHNDWETQYELFFAKNW